MAAQHLRSTGPLWWLRRIVAWTVVLGVGAVLVVAVAVPRAVGATPYAVLTASMRPGLPPGTLIVVRPVDVEDIAIGSVITFQLTSGEPEVVTHRVVGVGINPKGERVFTTQGDANGGADAKPVRPAQVRGEVWYSVPHLGFVEQYLTARTRQLAIMGLAGTLVLYAVAMLAGSIRDDRHPRPGPRHSNGVGA
jgi:signal peptidase